MASPRVLDAADNRLEALPPGLPPSLQRLVLANNRIASLAGLEALGNLKVGARGSAAVRARPRCSSEAAPSLPSGTPPVCPLPPPPRQVLDLSGNRIDRLPDSISRLTRLEALVLTDNSLAELPPALGALPRLRQLLVGQNRLRALPPELGRCAALEELDSHHNVLQVGCGGLRLTSCC